MQSTPLFENQATVIPYFAEVVLPIALPKTLTYQVPENLLGEIDIGKRVEVQLGKSRIYAGIVVGITEHPPDQYDPKPIIAVVDKYPIINEKQIKFLKWIASYYACTLGEAFNVALPANYKISSETVVTKGAMFTDNDRSLNDHEFIITEALRNRDELTLKEIKGLLKKKGVYKSVNSLLDKKLIYLKEEVVDRFTPKLTTYVRVADGLEEGGKMNDIFASVKNAPKQEAILLCYFQMIAEGNTKVKKKDLLQKSQGGHSAYKGLRKKSILEEYKVETGRLDINDGKEVGDIPLSTEQGKALENIRSYFAQNKNVLLEGVTGSGKTILYIKLIDETIRRGGKVLYLIPEIALTTQIINRLTQVFGRQILAYHSRMNPNQRLEVWRKVLEEHPFIIGARSSIFLPYSSLDLIIIDEEHDSSFKQYDPAPRYHARDAALYLAQMYGSNVLMGTATPSTDSLFNIVKGRLSKVQLTKRYGDLPLPELQLIDLKKYPLPDDQHVISLPLKNAIQKALQSKEQVILFQNRRGFAPLLECTTCDWKQNCVNCDVSLTYHKFLDLLQCHYCSHAVALPNECPQCGKSALKLRGFGTQKIEVELGELFSDARVKRMDLDTVKSKFAYQKIFHEFDEGEIDILVGTQMITKGLDFENVSLVGVLSADQIINYPDYRSAERAFQIITQVSGRPGRKKKQGLVMIQTYNPNHPILKDIIEGQAKRFYHREMEEREAFKYAPFYKMIKIVFKHKKKQSLEEGVKLFHMALENALLEPHHIRLGDRLVGPAVPVISRVRTQYLMELLIKIERNRELINAVKRLILATRNDIRSRRGLTSLRVNIDVDPI